MDCIRCNALMELKIAEDNSEFWWCPMCLYTEDLPVKERTPEEIQQIIDDYDRPEIP